MTHKRRVRIFDSAPQEGNYLESCYKSAVSHHLFALPATTDIGNVQLGLEVDNIMLSGVLSDKI